MNENEYSTFLPESIMDGLEADSPIYGIESSEQYEVPSNERSKKVPSNERSKKKTPKNVILTDSENPSGKEVLKGFEDKMWKVLSKLNSKKSVKKSTPKKVAKSTQKSKTVKTNTKAPVKSKKQSSKDISMKKDLNVTSLTAQFVWNPKNKRHETFIEYDGKLTLVYKNIKARDYRFLLEGYKGQGKKLREAGITHIAVKDCDGKEFTYEKGTDPILPKVPKSMKQVPVTKKKEKSVKSQKKSEKSVNSDKKSEKSVKSQKKTVKTFKSYSVTLEGHGALEGKNQQGKVVAKEGNRLIVETFNKKIKMKVQKLFNAKTGIQIDGKTNFYYTIEV